MGKWLNNATDGAKFIGEEMKRTPEGRKAFNALANAEYGVQLIYDKDTDIGKIGTSARGYNNKRPGETTSATITVFEKGVIAELDNLKEVINKGADPSTPPTKSQVAMMKNGIPEKAERVGQVGVHEAEHILNPDAYQSKGGDYEAVAAESEIKAIDEGALLKPLKAPPIQLDIP